MRKQKSEFFLALCAAADVSAANVREVLSFEHACELLNIKPTVPAFDEVPEDHRKPLQDHYKLVIIAQALNGDWVPDWSSYEFGKAKFYPWWYMSGNPSGSGFSLYAVDYGRTATGVGARLVYRNRDTARYAAEMFEHHYRSYFIK